MNQTELYERLNRMLDEREAEYGEREKSIAVHEAALKQFEDKLEKRVEEINEQEESLLVSQEQMKAERKILDGEQEKLKRQREELSDVMSQIAQAKLELKEKETEVLKLHNEIKEDKLQKSRDRLGIELPAVSENTEELRKLRQENEELKEQNEKLKLEKGNLLKKLGDILQGDVGNRTAIEEGKEEEKSETVSAPGMSGQLKDESMAGMFANCSFVSAPRMIEGLAESAKQLFPELILDEKEEEKLSFLIGDKTLRFITAEDPYVAEILTDREETKKLLSGIRRLNRMQSEWEFSYEDGVLACVMYFTEDMPAADVVEKCMYAINNYFKQ